MTAHKKENAAASLGAILSVMYVCINPWAQAKLHWGEMQSIIFRSYWVGAEAIILG